MAQSGPLLLLSRGSQVERFAAGLARSSEVSAHFAQADRCDGVRYYHAVRGSGRLTQALEVKQAMFKFPIALSIFVALLLVAFNVHAGQTVAPPSLQKTIWGVFPQGRCGKSINLKVLSSERTSDSKVEGGKLVAGEVREMWQATTCDTRKHVRYLFRLAPDKNGELTIIGFERAP